MDDLEDGADVRARQSPEDPTTTQTKSKHDDNDDDELWNASDDLDDDAAAADLNDDFTLAASASKLDISHNDGDADPSTSAAGPSQTRAETIAKNLASFDDFEDNEEDDDDFGEPAGAGEDDDDDFGAFDEADQDADFGDAFASSQPEAGPSSSSTAADNDDNTPKLPPLWLIDFEEIGTTREQIRPHIEALFAQDWPDWADYVSPDIPIPNGTDKENILVTEYNMKKYEEWVEKPPDFEPFDWKRSVIRRNMMQALGIPVNLDDLAPPKAMPNLVLPSIHTTPASPSKAKHSNALSSSAPPSSISRTNSPNRPSMPPIDIPKAKELSEFPESEMKFKTLAELEALRKELQEVAINASTHLTALLEKKEILSGQSETYNAMIQDLVREAQKMRSPANASKGSSIKRSNSTSSKNSSSTSAAAVAPAPNAAPRSSFFGGSSRPNSRPASPAPNNTLNVKTSVSKSSAAASTASPAKEARRSSLW